MNAPLQWGILGTGRIAYKFAKGIAAGAEASKVVAVGSRSPEAGERFGAGCGIARRHGTYEALLADPEVQAVYVATPHVIHATWAVRAAEAGKHILCEKPLAVRFPEAMAAVEAARVNGVFLMEGFMYRVHPQTARLVELLRDGAIGELRQAEISMCFDSPFDPADRLFQHDLAGGAILDLGCYCMSMARLLAGAASGHAFADPVEVRGSSHIHPQAGTDVVSAATVKFGSGFIAQLTCALQQGRDNAMHLHGSEGSILVPGPWILARHGGPSELLVRRTGEAEPRRVVVENVKNLYAIEADHVAACAGRPESPAMTHADSLGNAAALDAWRASAGMSYRFEAEVPQPIRGCAPRPRPGHAMRYASVPGIARSIARLVMGVDNQTSPAHAAVMFDDYLEKGGNCFDTAWVYGAGRHEKLLGGWLRARGVRDDIVLIGKGAHTPFCTPEWLEKQLGESLDRLGQDRLDIYIMHRDNPGVPVGEFVDVLNRLRDQGRFSVFGGSNWSIARFEEANAYAAARGLQPFGLLSNNFSLARMVDPVWAGCVACSDPDSRAWLERTNTPLFAWSSQARGFFTARADIGAPEDKDLRRCWVSEDNYRRRERAYQLAAERGVLPINIALAYVLCQSFPAFALFGPRTLEETRTSLPGLGVELSPAELAWLDLRAETR
jgi:predicted dehydrogenase/aryl-alcohol dehydrogenase-like predicted oxidoreductase